MYIKATEFPVMDGEKHLGKIVEEELIYDLIEIKNEVIQYIIDNDEIPKVVFFSDEHTDKDIEIIVSEYL